jgi:hypothetical protein
MLIYQLTTPAGTVQVSLNSLSSQESSEILFEGNPEAIAPVRRWLKFEYGAFGHMIGDHTTPTDLDFAMQSDRAAAFSPQRLEGAELINYQPGLPDESLS